MKVVGEKVWQLDSFGHKDINYKQNLDGSSLARYHATCRDKCQLS